MSGNVLDAGGGVVEGWKAHTTLCNRWCVASTTVQLTVCAAHRVVDLTLGSCPAAGEQGMHHVQQL